MDEKNIREATYTIKLVYGKEKTTLSRKNDGFSSFELLGILELISKEIIAQMAGEIKPDIVKREVVD